MKPMMAQPSLPGFEPAGTFEAFHRANPEVYALLRDFALEAVRVGRRRHLSIHLLFERLRWYTMIETEGDPYKLNNNWRAGYARLLMRQERELRGLFETRSSREDERSESAEGAAV